MTVMQATSITPEFRFIKKERCTTPLVLAPSAFADTELIEGGEVVIPFGDEGTVADLYPEMAGQPLVFVMTYLADPAYFEPYTIQVIGGIPEDFREPTVLFPVLEPEEKANLDLWVYSYLHKAAMERDQILEDYRELSDFYEAIADCGLVPPRESEQAEAV